MSYMQGGLDPRMTDGGKVSLGPGRGVAEWLELAGSGALHTHDDIPPLGGGAGACVCWWRLKG